MSTKVTVDFSRALTVVKIVVAAADEIDAAVLILGFEPSAQPAHSPDRHAYGMSLSQLRELRAKVDLAIVSLESHGAPKH